MEKDYAQWLRELLDIVLQEGASDLHLAPGRHPYLRVHNELIPLASQEILTPEDTVGLVKVMAPREKTAQLAKKEEIDFSYAFEGKLRLRGNAFVRRDEVSIALRAIESVRNFNDLKLPEIGRAHV